MKELICIVCPKGCHLQVDEQNDYQVFGNSCPRGAEYGKNELLHPTRVLTSIVKVTGGNHHIEKAMELLKPVQVKSPVHIGDVVVSNVCGTGVDWIATKNV